MKEIIYKGKKVKVPFEDANYSLDGEKDVVLANRFSGEKATVPGYAAAVYDVIIGSGAQILGPVVVGKNAKVGANAVVTKDVPENAVMVGIPAKNIGTSTEEFKPYAVTDESKENEK